MDQHVRPASGLRPGAGIVDEAAARAVVRDAILDLRPLVTQSRDGLTIVMLARKGRRPAGRSRAAWRPVAFADASASGGVSVTEAPDASVPSVVAEADRRDLAETASAFVLPPDAVAVAVGLFDRILRVDLFDDPAVLASAWPRLVEAAASAWLDRRRAVDRRLVARPLRSHPDDGAVGRLLRRAVAALDDAAVRPSVGVGADADVRLVGDRVHGSALVVRGRAVRVSLFRRERPEPPDRLVP